MRIQFKLMVAVGAMTLASSASAASIYQSLPDLTVSPIVRGYCSSCNSFLPFRLYDQFTLNTPGTIDSVTFAVDRQTIAGSSLNIGFFTANGMRPGASLASYDVNFADIMATQQATALENVFLYTAQIGGLALGTGTFDISFYNPNGLSIPAYQKTGGTLYQSGNFFQGDSFYADRAMAFSLDTASVPGAVPEPASWALMILGMSAVGFVMRRQRVSTTVKFA